MTGTKGNVIEDIGEYTCSSLTTVLSREVTNRRAELIVEAIGDLGVVEAGLALVTVSVCGTSFTTYALGAVRLTSETRLTECRSHLVKDVTRLTLTYD